MMATRQLFLKICSLATLIATNGAANDLSIYFTNDSLNGIRLSDAYETHDMGIKYSTYDRWYDLNLAIVSPDMYVYRNQFREANRSYGEIIQLTYGVRSTGNYCKFTTIGKFGLADAQDFAHRIFGLQPVADINDLVRMPKQFHVGCGTSIYNDFLGMYVHPYIGTDKAIVTAEKQFDVVQDPNFTLSGKFGASYIGYDKVVSAEPVSAMYRKVIPRLSLDLNYFFNENVSVSLSEHASLPTIEDDDTIFFQLSASINFKLH